MLGNRQHEPRWRLAPLSVAILLAGVWALPASAAEKGMTDKGRALVEEHCARCHAIGVEGDSPHPDAPPFRTDMPIFVFSPTDVQAIIDYLQSIQDQPAPDEDPAEE